MRTETKWRVRNLVTAIAICGASLALLPGVAQAQGLDLGPITAPVTAQVDNVAGADSQTDTTQGVSASEPSLVTGGVMDTTAVQAPVVPVQGTVAVDDTVTVPGVVEEDVCLNGAVNASPGTCGGATTPPPVPVTDMTVVDSQTEIPQSISTEEDSLVTGDVTDTTGVTAPVVPVQGTVAVDETVEVPGVVEEDVCLNVGVNEAPGVCGGETSPGANPGGGTVDDVIETIDEVVNDSSDDVVVDVGADAPVPVQTGVDTQVDAVVDEVADLGVCADVDVNQDTPGCQSGGSGGGVEVPEIPFPESDGSDLDGDAGVGDEIDAGICLDGVLGEDGSCDESADGNGGDQAGIIDACVGVLDSGICQQDEGDQGDSNGGGLVAACVGILDPGCNEGSGETPIADVCIGILAPACPNAADDGNGPGNGNDGGNDGNDPGNGNDPDDGGNNPGDGDNGNGGNDPGDDGNNPGDGNGNDGDENGNSGDDPDDGDVPGGNGDDDGSGDDSGSNGNVDDGTNAGDSSNAVDDGSATNGSEGSSAFADSSFVVAPATADVGANGLLFSGEMVLLSGTGGELSRDSAISTDSSDGAIFQDDATSTDGSDGDGQDAAANGGLDQLPDTGGVDVETLKFVFGALLLAFGLTGFLIALRKREAL